MSNDGKHIQCDGIGCTAEGTLPVGLRRAQAPLQAHASRTSEGWLFIQKGEKSLHFCPACGQTFLDELKGGR